MDGLTLSLVTAASTLAGCWGMLAANRISELKNRPRVTEKTEEPMPSLAVILPCHGSYSFARICERWNSQLNTTYSGPVSFVYVVESLDDPAFVTICRYLSQVHGLEEAGKAALSQDSSYLEKDIMLETSPHRSVRLAVAGVTSRSSQKIHNMLFALRDCTAEFVAFLDDDIKVHRGTLDSLVFALRANPHALVSTGYSVEVPVVQAIRAQKELPPFANQLIMVYRMINMISFAFTRVPFCWGGCFCMQRQAIYEGTPSPYSAWVDGGYSEDTILSYIAHQQGKSIICPRDAILVNELHTSNSITTSYIPYLCRQLFVLKTYHTHYEKVANRLFLVVVLGAFLSADSMIILAVARSICCVSKLSLLGLLRSLVFFRSIGAIDRLYSFLFHIKDKLGLSTELGAVMLKGQLFQVNTLVVTLALLAAVHNACFSLLVRLCNVQSPEKLQTKPSIRIGTTAVAILAHCFVMPILIISTMFKKQICWGSRTYVCSEGRVTSVKPIGSVLRPGKEKMSAEEPLAADKVPVVKERLQANKKSPN
ncbi:Ceramide glucosyltransferase [Giardia lamblia P15]|uniref:ceramide glucosyltransferase n=1 Tax=Giardia intestinalis (strain P15) TaxID=658858 RepID=E1F7C8_GIAIA|nr:Ceramide glucosyltransferase [Giardia lamblia P15]